MRLRPANLLYFLLLISITGSAQQLLTGKVYEKTTDSVLAGVSVFNTKTRETVRTARDGSYSIAAAEDHRIIFSMAGFAPDTVVVAFHMLLVPQDITLSIQAILLKGVTVIGSYSADSLARRNYYRNIYDSLTGVTGHNRPTDGVGISVSPLSYFSKKAKRQRELRKRLIKDERDAFIDHNFPVEWVQRLTGLQGDSLNLFMYRYRPSYDFCRNTDRTGMLVYINDKLKEFRRSPAVRPKG
jgi:hypothetical protein